MNENFIKIHSLSGELKFSHKKKDLGITVSTDELVLQKPHVNYHIRLEKIVGIVPFDTKQFQKKKVSIVSQRSSGNEIANMQTGAQHYRIYAEAAVMHNRSGVFELGPTEFIMPIVSKLLGMIAKYGKMEQLPLS